MARAMPATELLAWWVGKSFNCEKNYTTVSTKFFSCLTDILGVSDEQNKNFILTPAKVSGCLVPNVHEGESGCQQVGGYFVNLLGIT